MDCAQHHHIPHSHWHTPQAQRHLVRAGGLPRAKSSHSCKLTTAPHRPARAISALRGWLGNESRIESWRDAGAIVLGGGEVAVETVDAAWGLRGWDIGERGREICKCDFPTVFLGQAGRLVRFVRLCLLACLPICRFAHSSFSVAGRCVRMTFFSLPPTRIGLDVTCRTALFRGS